MNTDSANCLARTIGQLFILVALFILGLQIEKAIMVDYQYEKTYTQLWSLADKSSTIPAKQQYIAQFVAALESGNARGEFAPNDAIWLKTPNNSFASNLEALKSLSSRLNEIQRMNPSSFEYNTAIQQITAQEQGEAKEMLGVFDGCYALASYPIIWSWIGGVVAISSMAFIVLGIALWSGIGLWSISTNR